MGLLKLADKYLMERLEVACHKALSYTPHPNYKSMKNILITGQDKIDLQAETPITSQPESNAYGYTRGAENTMVVRINDKWQP